MLERQYPQPVTRIHTIALANLRQEDAAKDRLPNLAEGDGGTLGLADIFGAAVVGSVTNNTERSEKCAHDFAIPADYRDNENLIVRLNAFVTAARAQISNLSVVAKLIKNGALDATDLSLTAAIDIKNVVVAANHDFTIDGDAAGDLISNGDVLHIEITAAMDDAPGGSGGLFQMNKVSVLVPSWE